MLGRRVKDQVHTKTFQLRVCTSILPAAGFIAICNRIIILPCCCLEFQIYISTLFYFRVESDNTMGNRFFLSYNVHNISAYTIGSKQSFVDIYYFETSQLFVQ